MLKKHRHTKIIKKNGYKVIECQTCGYWHVYPKPNEDQLSKYYKEKYFNDFTKINDRSMTDKYSDPDGFYNIQYHDRLRYILEYFPKYLKRSVIDIGAGYGDFLCFMQKKGWTTSGIEPASDAFRGNKAKQLGILKGSIDKMCPKLAPASVITINNVLEHVPDPQKTLKLIRKMLLPGGIVSIVVPNDFNILQQVLMNTINGTKEKQNYWLTPLEHLNYWTTQTIKDFLKIQKFEILDMISDYPMELFALMGEDYISHPELGQKVHLKRVCFEKKLEKAGLGCLKEALYKDFANIGIGRNIQIIAKLIKT